VLGCNSVACWETLFLLGRLASHHLELIRGNKEMCSVSRSVQTADKKLGRGSQLEEDLNVVIVIGPSGLLQFRIICWRCETVTRLMGLHECGTSLRHGLHVRKTAQT